ncbi:putative D-xylulose reductase A [Lachnellula willkommii]|uniref:D-xylulose reductase n=1 Tax=Lachnellula willkommii TaxID=215461 RepID=A0A559MID7_9HELO|nr:putative D-xylulose reductase A [Lachnellula willkommii]
MENPSCFLYGPGIAKIENSPYPTITDEHDVVLNISFVGVCGSDVHFWNHGGILNKVDASRPLIMGHEASGVVWEVGKAVSSLQKGDRLAIEPGFPCRRCKNCKSGRYNLCPQMTFAADPPYSHGTLRKYYKIPEDFCYKLPDSVALDEGVLVEPLSVAVHASRQADIKVGQVVVVFGAGTVGVLCAAVAKAMGARKIISVDVNASRLEFATGFAATGSYLPAREDSPEETALKIKDLHALGEGADVVLEATGAEICIDVGIQVLRRGGTFIQVGLGKSKVQFPISALSEKEINMKGCFRYGAGDYELAMHLLDSKKVAVKDLITGVFPFEEATQAWECTKSGQGIKTLIRGAA